MHIPSKISIVEIAKDLAKKKKIHNQLVYYLGIWCAIERIHELGRHQSSQRSHYSGQVCNSYRVGLD